MSARFCDEVRSMMHKIGEVRFLVAGTLVGLWALLLGDQAGRAQDKPIVRERPGSVAAPNQGRRWAVIIGVNDYLDPSISSLQFCVADARLVAERLIGRGGYDPRRILLLT